MVSGELDEKRKKKFFNFTHYDGLEGLHIVNKKVR